MALFDRDYYAWRNWIDRKVKNLLKNFSKIPEDVSTLSNEVQTLSEKIENYPELPGDATQFLNGTGVFTVPEGGGSVTEGENYIFIYATANPEENFNNLVAAMETAKDKTPFGRALSFDNRYTIFCTPGMYKKKDLENQPLPLPIHYEYIDIQNIEDAASIKVNSVDITATNVRIKGLYCVQDDLVGDIEIANPFDISVSSQHSEYKFCRGGDNSFLDIAGTYIGCEAYNSFEINNSFKPNSDGQKLQIIDCKFTFFANDGNYNFFNLLNPNVHIIRNFEGIGFDYGNGVSNFDFPLLIKGSTNYNYTIPIEGWEYQDYGDPNYNSYLHIINLTQLLPDSYVVKQNFNPKITIIPISNKSNLDVIAKANFAPSIPDDVSEIRIGCYNLPTAPVEIDIIVEV